MRIWGFLFFLDDLQTFDLLEGEAHYAAVLALVLEVDRLLVVVDEDLRRNPAAVVEPLGPLGDVFVHYPLGFLAHPRFAHPRLLLASLVFLYPKGAPCIPQRGLKPLMHRSAWNRYSRKFVHKEGRSLSFAVRDSGPVDARLLRDMPSLRCFPRQLLTRLVLGPLLFLLRRRLWSPESGVEHG